MLYYVCQPFQSSAGWFEDIYNNAQSTLSGFRRDDKYCDVKEEQSSLFNRKRSSSVSQSWTHKFVCLSSTNADRVPFSKLGRLVLEQAGLGEKSITVPNHKLPPRRFSLPHVDYIPKAKRWGWI